MTDMFNEIVTKRTL